MKLKHINELIAASKDILSNMHVFSRGSPWFERQERLKLAIKNIDEYYGGHDYPMIFIDECKDTTFGHLYSPEDYSWQPSKIDAIPPARPGQGAKL